MEPYAHGLLDAGDGHRVYWDECGNPEGRLRGIPGVLVAGRAADLAG